MSLDNYIKNTAYGDTISLDAATSLVIQDEEVVAFFTLNDDFSFKVIDPDTNEVEEIFAIEIQYLGVHNDHQKQGIGKQIIYHIFEICKRLNHRFVFLQSVVSAVEYYKKFNFKELELETTPERAVSLYTDLLDPTVVESYWNP